MKPQTLITTLCAPLHRRTHRHRRIPNMAARRPGIWKGRSRLPRRLQPPQRRRRAPLATRRRQTDRHGLPLTTNPPSTPPSTTTAPPSASPSLDEDIYGLGVDFKSMRRLHLPTPRRPLAATAAPTPRPPLRLQQRLRRHHQLPATSTSTSASPSASTPRKTPALNRNDKSSNWAANPRSDSIDFLIPAPAPKSTSSPAPPHPSHPATQPPLRRRRHAPKWGLGFLTRTPASTPPIKSKPKSHNSKNKKSPSTSSAWNPAGNPPPTPARMGQIPLPRPQKFLADMAAQHPHQPLVQPLRQTRLRSHANLAYAGSLVWNGMVPDYSMQEARRIFADHLAKTCVDIGVAGFKIDEVDGYDQWLWPDRSHLPQRPRRRTTPAKPSASNRTHDLRFVSRPQRRTFGQVRGTNAIRFPFVIYNDNYDFNEYITAVGNTGFAGVLLSPRSPRRRRTCSAARKLSSASLLSPSSTAGPPTPNSGPIPKSPMKSATPSNSATVCCLTGTQLSRNTTSKAHPADPPDALIEGAPDDATKSRRQTRRHRKSLRHRQSRRNQRRIHGRRFFTRRPDRPRHKIPHRLFAARQMVRFLHRPTRRRWRRRSRYRHPHSRKCRCSLKTALTSLIPEGQTMPGPDDKTPLEIRHYTTRTANSISTMTTASRSTTKKATLAGRIFRQQRCERKMEFGNGFTDPNKPWHYSEVDFTFMPQENDAFAPRYARHRSRFRGSGFHVFTGGCCGEEEDFIFLQVGYV